MGEKFDQAKDQQLEKVEEALRQLRIEKEENDPRKLTEQCDRLTSSIGRYQSDARICEDVMKSMAEAACSFMGEMHECL